MHEGEGENLIRLSIWLQRIANVLTISTRSLVTYLG